MSAPPSLTARYAVIQCVANMAYCCVASFAAVFLLSRGFRNADVGLTLTVASGLSLVAQPLVASFADRTRRLALRQIVALLMAGCVLAALLLTLTPALGLATAALYVVLVCAFNSQFSLVTSMSMEHINAGTPINFSLARGIGSFAFAVVALALGSLTSSYGGGIVPPATMAISLVGIAAVLTFPKAARPSADGGGGGERAAEEAASLWEFARRNARFVALVGSVALLYFSHVLINTYAIQIVTNVGGTSADMGVASAIGGFLELPAMALFPLIMRRFPRPGAILALSGVALVLKTVATLLAPSVGWIYAAQCLQFFAFAMFVPSSVYYVNEVIPGADKVKGQASMGMAMGISGLIGSFAGGFMLDTSGGVGLMLGVGLGISLAGLALVLLLIERPRPALAPRASS